MTSKLKNIIKLNVGNLLNEVDKVPVSDLPQKKVVDSDTAHNSAVAQSTLGNIDQRFRELGVGINSGAMHTPKLLAAMGSFNFGFKIGDTEYKGQAKVVNQSPLTLVFNSSVEVGETTVENPTITFVGDLKTKEAESGVDVTAISVGGTYDVTISSSKTQVVFGDDEKLVVGPDEKKRIRPVFDLTAKSGKTYKASPNPDKQSDVVDGSVNVTIIEGPQKNKSFAVSKSKLIKTDLSAFFPNGGEPKVIKSQEDSKGPKGKILITHLPEIQGKEEAGGKNNAKLDLSNPINVSGRLQVTDDEGFKKVGGNEEILKKLNNGLSRASALKSESKQLKKVAKIKLTDGTIMMLQPEDTKFPDFIKNWSGGLNVLVLGKAGNNDGLGEFKATATLKTR